MCQYIYIYVCCNVQRYVQCKYIVYINIYIYIYTIRHPIFYIQYGKLPTRDSRHPSPPHAGAAAGRAGKGKGGAWDRRGVGWTLYGYISILDTRYWVSLYIYMHILIYVYKCLFVLFLQYIYIYASVMHSYVPVGIRIYVFSRLWHTAQ